MSGLGIAESPEGLASPRKHDPRAQCTKAESQPYRCLLKHNELRVVSPDRIRSDSPLNGKTGRAE